MCVPTYFLIAVVAGWLNRQQQAVIEYLKATHLALSLQCVASPGYSGLEPGGKPDALWEMQ